MKTYVKEKNEKIEYSKGKLRLGMEKKKPV
jgi:hypothetical protein